MYQKSYQEGPDFHNKILAFWTDFRPLNYLKLTLNVESFLFGFKSKAGFDNQTLYIWYVIIAYELFVWTIH
jgi:hypothetical protein